MVMLHGLGDSIEGYRWWPEALGLPWLNHLLVNAPDDYYGGYSWFDIDDLRRASCAAGKCCSICSTVCAPKVFRRNKSRSVDFRRAA